MVPPLVDLIRSISIILCPRINRPPFPIPHTQTMLIRPIPLPFVRLEEPLLLCIRPFIRLRRAGEAINSIIMNRIRHIPPPRPRIFRELCKVSGERVPVQEDNMLFVNLPDGLVGSIIECDQGFMLRIRISRFVEDVVSRNPRVILVSLDDALPDPDESILEVLVSPKVPQMRTSISMPSTALTTRSGMHVDNSVDVVLCEHIDGAVEMLEGVSLENTGVEVIFRARQSLNCTRRSQPISPEK